MNKLSILKLVLAAAGLLGAASIAIHPSGAMKSGMSTERLLKGAAIDPEALALMQRSCQNCHSEKTDWPWYSYVAPMSWLIENDVREGRNHMNLSRWQDYTGEKQQELLSEVGVMARTRRMPPPKYTLLHPGAKLTNPEIDQLYKWCREERRRLRSLDERNSPPPG